MAMDLFLVFVLVSSSFCCSLITAQDCSLPTQSEIENLLKPLLASSDGGSPSDFNPSIIGSVHYVCQAQGSIKDTYRAVSIIANYTANTGQAPRINIFEFICDSGPVWATNGVLATPPNGLTAPTRTDCYQCSSVFGDDRCRVCDSSCSGTCLGRCVGSPTTCCAVFTADGACSTDTNCTSSGVNYSATESTDCSCTCNLCSPGYTANSNCTECSFTDICKRDEPCQHGGDCILLSAPVNYTCNCTGTGYGGANCSTEYLMPTTSILQLQTLLPSLSLQFLPSSSIDSPISYSVASPTSSPSPTSPAAGFPDWPIPIIVILVFLLVLVIAAVTVILVARMIIKARPEKSRKRV